MENLKILYKEHIILNNEQYSEDFQLNQLQKRNVFLNHAPITYAINGGSQF